ncbi:VOC family protein [Occallatibacter riparius]|uniref:VOC family protein n=1 Tax=Occallatibacter riparius TaxID=1002689 RepID=A0A9J7BMK4_9BACT|nr:VOC family protein [Occallatibacter riparius]UWZ82142.1 VOC family protein [Occallatibacter riparius]
MATPNFIMLYVADAKSSADFYQTILGRKPVQYSEGYSMFVLDNGFRLGLWKRGTIDPPAEISAGSGELVFEETSDAAVDERFAEWTGQGTVVAQKPTRMSFGYTFVALDPDGNRLRVYKLAQ